MLLREEKGGYEVDIFEDLIRRFEEPEGRNRWDSPLFTVPYEDETLPLEAIWNAMMGEDGRGSGRVKQHAATILVGAHIFMKSPSPTRLVYSAFLTIPFCEIIGSSCGIRLPLRAR